MLIFSSFNIGKFSKFLVDFGCKLSKRKINEIFNKMTSQSIGANEQFQLRANNRLMTFDVFKQGLQRVATEEHNTDIEVLKKQWVQTRKKRDALIAKQTKTNRKQVMVDTYQNQLDYDKQIVKMLKNKPYFDIIREYLIYLGLGNKEKYLSKISNPQPFQIRDASSRIVKVKKKDHYTKYIQKIQKDAPSKRHILEVITKARHQGLLTKRLNTGISGKSLSTPSKVCKKADNIKPPLVSSYKEMSQRKKKLDQQKINKKSNKQENELKQRILEEQKRLKEVEKERIRNLPPPIVTLQELAKNSFSNFYQQSTSNEELNDSAIDFIKNMIATDEDVDSKAGDQIVEIYDLDNGQVTEYHEDNRDLNQREQYHQTQSPKYAEETQMVDPRQVSVHDLQTAEDTELNARDELDPSRSHVQVVVSTKNNKKIKAILPADHQRNIRNSKHSHENNSKLVLYDSNNASKNVSVIMDL